MMLRSAGAENRYFEAVRECGPATNQERPPLTAAVNFKIILVGARGFEPPTSRSQTERTTRLCYAPKVDAFYEATGRWSS